MISFLYCKHALDIFIKIVINNPISLFVALPKLQFIKCSYKVNNRKPVLRHPYIVNWPIT